MDSTQIENLSIFSLSNAFQGDLKMTGTFRHLRNVF